MATTHTHDTGGNSAATIILAFIIIAALAVGAVWYMGSPASISTSNTTTERYITTVEKVPAQIGQAAKDATTPTVNPPSQDTAPDTATNTPAPTPVQ